MRKWLIGLTAAAGAGLALYLKRKLRRKRALGFVERFMAALQDGGLESLMNETALVPEKGWVDRFAGSVAGQPFAFHTRVEIGTDPSEVPGSRREYYLSWGGKWVRASVVVDPGDADPNAFQLIHEALKRVYRELDDTRPS